MLVGHALGRRAATDVTCARKLISAANPGAINTSRFHSTAPAARSFTIAIRAKPSYLYSRRLFSNSATIHAPRAKAAPASKSKSTTKKSTSKSTKKTPAKKTKPKPKKSTATKRKPKAKAQPTEAQALRSKVKRLREVALLNHPKMLPSNGYMVYMVSRSKDANVKEAGNVVDFAKTTASTYRSMPESEKQSFKRQADANVVENQKIMEGWIKQHTPDQIRLANNARRSLNRIAASPPPAGSKTKIVPHRYVTLKDSRITKRPNTPYMIFVTQRWASGDYAGVKVGEATRALSREWKALSNADKQRYIDEYAPLREASMRERAALFPTTQKAGKGRQSKGTQTA